ncbi:uncharacterized protein [Eleutherodactylus coqui]
MKLILVSICLFSEAFLLPTQSPDDVSNTDGCCEQNPKLIYKGHTSTRGLNVYVFEFLPENKEAKDKRGQDDRSAFKHTENTEGHEDTIIPTNKPASIKAPATETSTRSNTHMPNLKLDTNDSTKSIAQNDIEMYGDAGFVPNTTEGLKGTENRENHEDTIIPTNKPASMYGKETTPNKETSTRDNTHRPNVKFDANSTISATQNDIGIYENTNFLFNATGGLQTETSHTRDGQTNGYSNGPDYYGTEGSALFDIPGYNDTDSDNQGPQVDFPANVNDLGCSESEGQCKNLPKSEEHILVTQPTTHKDYFKSTTKDKPDRYTNRERNTKKSMQPKKAKKHKGEKQTHSTIHTKDIPIRYNTGKTFQYSRGQRRKIGGNRHKYYRSSSSESRSESSQEFD